MFASGIFSAVLLMGSAVSANVPDQTAESRWFVHGTVKGQPTEDLSTDIIAASAYSEEGPGLVFICSKEKGLFTVLAYEPESDLFEQAVKTQNFLRAKTGTITLDGDTYDENWLWKSRHDTLQAKSTSTGVKLLNAVFSGKPVEFAFEGMDPLKLNFPKAGPDMMGFIENCPTTTRRAAE